MSFSIDGVKFCEYNGQFSVSAIAKFDLEYFSYPWKLSDWKSSLCNRNYKLFIASIRGEVIGFALWNYIELEELAHLLKVLVIPRYRGQNLGYQLLSFSELYLKNDGANKFYLEVENDNTRAIKIYSCLSYKVINEVKRFYSSGKDAIIMMK